MIIPARLQMNYWTSVRNGLNDKWTAIPPIKQKGINYDWVCLSFQSNIYFTRANQSDGIRKKNVKLKMVQRNC
jgi:hypothetical protein